MDVGPVVNKLAATMFFLSKHLHVKVDKDTGLTKLVKHRGDGKTYRNPFRKAIKRLRAKGGKGRKQARVLARAARDAARQVHMTEVEAQRAAKLWAFLESDRDRLTKAAESAKVET